MNEITEKVMDIIKENQPYIDFDDTTNLLEGIIDSVSLLLLVSELEMEYNISIEMKEIEPENFESVNQIVKFLEGKLK